MQISKKADLSMSTIVMAIIAVLILIILASIIVSQLGGQNQELKSCSAVAGRCSDVSCNEREDGYTAEYRNAACYIGTERDRSLTCCVVGG